jgi:hypothetical protein
MNKGSEDPHLHRWSFQVISLVQSAAVEDDKSIRIVDVASRYQRVQAAQARLGLEQS